MATFAMKQTKKRANQSLAKKLNNPKAVTSLRPTSKKKEQTPLPASQTET